MAIFKKNNNLVFRRGESMKKIILGLSLSFVTLFATNITLGVVPQQSPLKLSKKWLKITTYLKNETGINVVFNTEKSIPQFENSLYRGNYDIAYMNPYHFIVAKDKQNYRAFVRAKKYSWYLSCERRTD